jgi:hypothetical protein
MIAIRMSFKGGLDYGGYRGVILNCLGSDLYRHDNFIKFAEFVNYE